MDTIFWNGGIDYKRVRLGSKSNHPHYNENCGLNRSIGPYKIAHWLRKNNYSAQVIEFVDLMTLEQLYAATKKFITRKTKVLGISTTFLCNSMHTHSDGNIYRIKESILAALRLIKKQHPHIKIIAGGYVSDHISGWGIVDATIMSYTSATEDIFLEYMNHLTFGTEPPIGSYKMPRFGNTERMMYDQARNKTYNIETDDFRFISQDAILPGEPLPLDVSRGCIFACKFCQYPHLGRGKFDYTRHMNLLEEELLHNYNNFGTTSYFLLDDTFNDTERKMQQFHSMTSRLPFKIQYSTYLRADLIHRFPDTAHLLKESGLVGAFFGLESLHPYASKLIGKSWSGTHAKMFIPNLYHNIWKKEVAIHSNFIIGLPEETKDDIRNTFAWSKDNDLHCTEFRALALFGKKSSSTFNHHTILSEFDKNAEKYGFEFTSESNGSNDNFWKNSTWTYKEALDLDLAMRAEVEPINKATTWQIPILLWYGYSKELLLNTRYFDINVTDLKTLTENKFDEYYRMLMSL
jgi:hypothetical protein